MREHGSFPPTLGAPDGEPRRPSLWAYVWASPATAIGLLFVLPSLPGGGVRIVDGVIEVHGWLTRFFLTRCIPLQGGASAMTLGHVVIGRNAAVLESTRTHERIHVRQYQRWGPFFIPAYLGVSLFLLLSGRDAYRDNPFEQEAFDQT